MAEVRVGVVGTGFIASNFLNDLGPHREFRVARVLTRRALEEVGLPPEMLTNSPDDLLSNCDVIVECSGDPIWATDIVAAAVEARRPVVTMNTEFHITTGSAFVGSGLITEAEGDQPGCLASLHEDAVSMGFTPVAYGNMKGFLNPNPTEPEMRYWAAKQGISLPMVTSFTDGTKVQAEQILVANHVGATIAQEGMLGRTVDSLEEASKVLVEAYERVGQPISDFVVSPSFPHGVFLIATHASARPETLEYYKLGSGPYYTIVRNNIFVHLEIMKTVRRMLEGGDVLLHNSSIPKTSLGAITKRDLRAGTRLSEAIGSFDLRGHAIHMDDHPDHVPIGLLRNSVVTKDLAAGSLVRVDAVELEDSLAVRLWKEGKTSPTSSTEEVGPIRAPDSLSEDDARSPRA